MTLLLHLLQVLRAIFFFSGLISGSTGNPDASARNVSRASTATSAGGKAA